MELSHNDGIEDQHLPLQAKWMVLGYHFDNRVLIKYFKILEFRNTSNQKNER